MANPFMIQPVNSLSALMAAVEGYNTADKRAEEQKLKDALAAAGPDIASGNYQSAIGALAGTGNLQSLATLAGLQHQKTQEGQAQAQLAEAIRSHRATEGLTAQGLQGKPQDHIIKDANDNPVIVRTYPDGRPAQDITPQSVAAGFVGGGNPFSYGKQNENQSKDSGYANRMFQAEGVFRDPKAIAAGADLTQRAIDKAPLVGSSGKLGLGNYLQSDDYQRYDQAGRDFINAVLRRESGAAINQSEFDNAYKQYLPRPGDSAEVLAQKQRNRQAAIAGVAGGGGQHYRPPFTFGPTGDLVPNANASRQGVAAVQNDPRPISDAREAIARGANPQAVAERLRKNGIKFDPRDLELN